MMKMKNSKHLYKRAEKLMPGGVNSPVRSGLAVGHLPLFIKSGRGSKVCDADGNVFIDYIMSWGALILGHSHPRVIAAVRKAMDQGMSFGVSTEREIILTEMISAAIPSLEMLRLVNSGTEAVMSAIRLARGFTGRDKIIKFSGCYHGHSDSLLVDAGSGSLTFGYPSSRGVPRDFSRNTIVVPYNDINRFNLAIKKYHREIAAVIIEPVAANMGLVLPQQNFLADIRHLTEKHRIILIFDEVITGFRCAYGSVQAVMGINPDLTCLGKIIGGGLPLAAFGGRKEIMRHIAPLGKVYQAGTLSGNPLAVSAGAETLKILSGLDYKKIEVATARLCDKIEDNLRSVKIPFCLNRLGPMFTLFFTSRPVRDLDTARKSDTKYFARFYNQMLAQGVMLPPSQFESCFLSFAHTAADTDKTARAVLSAVKNYRAS